MTLREQAVAIWRVAKLSFKTAPGSVLFKLTGAIIDAALPFVTAFFAALTTTALVEAYSGNDAARDDVLLYVVITVLLGLVSLVWRSIDRYIQETMRFRIEAKVSDIMYEQFLSLDFWRYDDKETADLYEKAQNFARFFAWIFDRLASVFTELATMVVGVGALFAVNAWLALFVLVAIIPGVYLQFKLSRAQIRHWNTNVDTRRTRYMIESDMLQPRSITELRIYGLVKYLLKLRADLRYKDEKIRLDFEKKYIPKQIAAYLLQTVAEMASLIWITLEIVNRNQPVGQFVYVQQVVSRAIGGASGFINLLSTIDEDVANLFEYERFMQLPLRTEGGVGLKTVPSEIVVSKVDFGYPGQEKLVLKDVSLTIKRNQSIAIVGENGAGKSTLVKLLAGLYSPLNGEITVDGLNLSDVKISDWHRMISVLHQDFTRYDFASARDNVRFGDVEKQDEKLLKDSLERAEASTFTSKLPKGLDSYVNNWMEDDDGVKGVDLSGGQWQRLALARNFYRNSPIIILDEPTSAIDALAESKIFKRLFEEDDKTIIVVSHRLTTVKKADIIYMMKDGEIVESGAYKDMLERKGEFYKMFESQL